MAFALFGLLPWIVGSLVLLAILVYSTENDAPITGTLAIIATLAALQIFSDFQPLSLVLHSTLYTGLAVLAWIGIGILVGILKWTSYAYQMAERWTKARADAVREYTGRSGNPTLETAFTESDRKSMLQLARSYFGFGSKSYPLVVTQHKKRITTWMIYWPATAFWLLLDEPIKRLYDFIYNRLGGLLTSISDRASAGHRADFQ